MVAGDRWVIPIAGGVHRAEVRSVRPLHSVTRLALGDGRLVIVPSEMYLEVHTPQPAESRNVGLPARAKTQESSR